MFSVSENTSKMKKKVNYGSMYMYALFRHIYVCTAADEISTSLQPTYCMGKILPDPPGPGSCTV